MPSAVRRPCSFWSPAACKPGAIQAQPERRHQPAQQLAARAVRVATASVVPAEGAPGGARTLSSRMKRLLFIVPMPVDVSRSAIRDLRATGLRTQAHRLGRPPMTRSRHACAPRMTARLCIPDLGPRPGFRRVAAAAPRRPTMLTSIIATLLCRILTCTTSLPLLIHTNGRPNVTLGPISCPTRVHRNSRAVSPPGIRRGQH